MAIAAGIRQLHATPGRRWTGIHQGLVEACRLPRLVIIDTLAMVRMPNRRDQNSYDADYAAVKDLRDLATKHGIAIILCTIRGRPKPTIHSIRSAARSA